MTILTLVAEPMIADAKVHADTLLVRLDDGREISAPIDWFPRLRDASPAERDNWRLIGHGEGIHWPDIDEDISARGLLSGYAPRAARQGAA